MYSLTHEIATGTSPCHIEPQRRKSVRRTRNIPNGSSECRPDRCLMNRSRAKSPPNHYSHTLNAERDARASE